MVSVIIPNYNHAPFLANRIESILGQSFQDFELIILDDCSSDNSREIIDTYRAHPRVSHVVYNEQNSGNTFRQWAKGISLAKGEYIWIAESDDSCHPRFLQTMVNGLSQHPGVVLAFANSQRMDAAGNLHNKWTDNYYGEAVGFLKDDFLLSGDVLASGPMLYLNAVPNASGAVFRRAVALKAGMPPEHFRLVGDWYFWVKLLKEGEVLFVAEPLNYFRFHDKTVRKTTQKKGEGLLEILKIMSLIKCWYQPAPSAEQTAVNYLLFTWHQLGQSKSLSYNRHLKIYRQAIRAFPAFKGAITKELLKILYMQLRA